MNASPSASIHTDTGTGASAVRALFDAALELPSPIEREAYVRQRAGPNTGLAEQVLTLLAYVSGGRADDERFLSLSASISPSAMDQAQPPSQSHRAAHSGQQLGAWRLSERLGSGGMGEVWLAERADGLYQGEAAVKLLKRGMDSHAVLARFAQERRALARLQHPHIARLLDAGVTEEGLPYFVMERVQGAPIDKACEGQSLEQRLQWFLQLCEAVAHAHRSLLVHRDLKPGNVWVDAASGVKLLDFGIAKALQSEAGDAGAPNVATTRQGPPPYTPTHASPEQVRGEPVTTATDVYSLGVLLYEMLTGRRPYGREVTSAFELAKAVLDQAPTRPSRLGAPKPEAQATWLSTRTRLQGDLETVLLKALEKEPARRYASVDALAADLRAYLAHQPISARPTSQRYVLAKFVQRNRLAVALAAGLLLALSAGLGATAWQAHEAAQARDAAQQQLASIKGLTRDLVHRFADSLTYISGGAKTQDPLLAQTQAALEPLLARSPNDSELQALLASTLTRRALLLANDSFAGPGTADQASALLERSIALGRQVWAQQRGDWRFAQQHGSALWLRGNVLRNGGQEAQAEAFVQEALAAVKEALPLAQSDVYGRAALGVEVANFTIAQAQTLQNRKPQEALALLGQAEPSLAAMAADTALHSAVDQRAAPGEIPAEQYLRHQLGTVLAVRAVTHLRLDDPGAALTDLQTALPMRRANVAAAPENVAWQDGLAQELHHTALAYLRLSEAPSALRHSGEAWALLERLAAREGPKSKWALQPRVFGLAHARALWQTGDSAQAQAVVAKALEIGQTTRGTQNNPSADLRIASLKALQAAISKQAKPLQEAIASLPALHGDAGVGRAAQLMQAEALSWLAALDAAGAVAHRQQALGLLEAAAQVQALGPDHQKLRALLLKQMP